MKQKLGLIIIFAVVVALLAACGGQAEPEVVEVTRVVTETEQIEVTRVVEGEVVTEIQEVEVTRVVEGEGEAVAAPLPEGEALRRKTVISLAVNPR